VVIVVADAFRIGAVVAGVAGDVVFFSDVSKYFVVSGSDVFFGPLRFSEPYLHHFCVECVVHPLVESLSSVCVCVCVSMFVCLYV
jgi:hypothetical protein